MTFESTVKVLVPLAALSLSLVAHADPIIEVIDGGDVNNGGMGTPDGTLGGFSMSLWDRPLAPTSGCAATGYTEFGVTSASSPFGDGGTADFVASDGTTPLCMSVKDPTWWQWDHGNVYTTTVNWVEIILPVNTRAFWLYTGGTGGRGWIEGEDPYGNTTRVNFGGRSGIDFGNGDTPGFGVYNNDTCGTITRIVVEPFEWGMGNFASNQDSCVSVPEPAPIGLLGVGLLGLALARRRLKVAPVSLSKHPRMED